MLTSELYFPQMLRPKGFQRCHEYLFNDTERTYYSLVKGIKIEML